MRRHISKATFGWFLFGLGSQLQLWGVSLSFTELFVFAAAPFLIFSEYWQMRKNGVSLFFWLSILLVISAAFSCWANHSPVFAVIRGMAVVCIMPCAIVVCHWLLRRDLGGFKWYLVGVAISSVLCTFVFHRSVELSMWAQGVNDGETSKMIMSGPLFWIERLGSFALLGPKGWYISFPILISAFMPLSLALFSIMTSASGRSAALGTLATCVLVLIGGRSQSTIKNKVCRRVPLLAIWGILFVLFFYGAYRLSATSGWLGEAAQQKYYKQTKGGKGGIGALLMGGRMDSFCGYFGCIDRPLVGFGPWPSTGGEYVEDFLVKYGDFEDAENYCRMQLHAFERGERVGILCHSHVTMFWCWFGLGGLIFIGYVIYIQLRYLCQDCWVIPQWYMWLAANVLGFLWTMFFSPLAGRVGLVLISVSVLMARAVRRGRLSLPPYMIQEIVKHGRK